MNPKRKSDIDALIKRYAAETIEYFRLQGIDITKNTGYLGGSAAPASPAQLKLF